MKNKIYIFIFGLLMMLEANAQNYFVHQYNYNNGLISASNDYIYQDSTGFIWNCSFGGLVRFDGTDFRSFDNSDGLSNYHVTHIFEERKNKFWVCNRFKLCAFDGHTFKAQHTNLPNGVVFVNLLKLSNGKILLNTEQGYFERINDSTYSRFVLPGIKSEDILAILEYSPRKIIAFDRNTKKLFHIINGTLHDTFQLEKNAILYRLSAINNIPYISLSDKMYFIQNNELRIYTPPGFNKSTYITSLYKDQKGGLWFTDSHFHLWKLNKNELINFSAKYDVEKVIGPSYTEDRNGNVLVSHINGLYVFRESFFKEVPMPELDSYNLFFVSSFYGKDTLCYGIAKNQLILITDAKKVIKQINTKNYIPHLESQNCYIHKTKFPNTYFIFVRRNGIYFLQNNELRKFNTGNYDFSKLPLSSVYDSANNYYYVGVSNYLLRIRETKIDTIDITVVGEEMQHAHSFHLMDDGTLYFLSRHKYLFSLKDGKLQNNTQQLNLDGKEFTIFDHKNTLWVLVHGIEIRAYKKINNQLVLQNRITKKNGLIDANANAIMFDDNDNLWINAFSGLYFLKNVHDSNATYYSKKIQLHIGNNEAPLLDHINYSNNSLYTVGKGGILIINTQSTLFETLPIKTYLSSIKFNNKFLSDLEGVKAISQTNGKYEFPYNYNSATFQVSTIYYGYDNAIQYQYLLKGQDKEWKTLLRTNEITYNNMPNGSYTLYVRSANQVNMEAYTETSFQFTINPPYYKTWWFSAFISLVAIGLIAYLIWQRDKSKLKENKLAIQMSELKLETLQSQMNPHFTFNALNSIQNYILNNNQIEAARYLSKFSKLIRKTLDNSHHQFIPLEEIVHALNMYLELEAFRFNHEFTYTVKMNEKDDRIFNIELPSMLLQPFVENSILHGLMPKKGNKRVDIHVYIENDTLCCVIDDNGVGRNDKVKIEGHVSRGQKLIEGMLESLNHLKMSEPHITFVDKKTSTGDPLGTTVHIIIPIEK